MVLSSGFLAGPGEAAKAKPAVAAGELPEKSHVIVKTDGPFQYDLPKERARFDSPPAGAPSSPDQVLVSREHKLLDGSKKYVLICL